MLARLRSNRADHLVANTVTYAANGWSKLRLGPYCFHAGNRLLATVHRYHTRRWEWLTLQSETRDHEKSLRSAQAAVELVLVQE